MVILFKNWHILILVAVLCSVFLIGCKSNNAVKPTVSTEIGDIGDTGGLSLPLTKTPQDITIFMDCEFPNRAESLAVKELSRRTGINIKIMEVPQASIAEKAKVVIASGNMPDIMTTLPTLAEVNDFGMQGAFVAVNEYINELPNLKRIFFDDENNNWVLKSCVASDGKLYYWPRYECVRPVNHGFLYRKDIFEKHGIKEWNNKEEFYSALKKLKELYPDSLPYTSKTKEKIFQDWSISWGMSAPNPYYDENEGKWKLSSTDQKFKEMLDFMKKLYAEGLIDPEFLTDTQASWISKMVQPNKTFTTFDWISRMDSLYEMAKETNPEYNLRFAKPIGPTGNVITTSNVGIGYGLMVANKKNALLSLKLLDYLASPSGAELMTLGIEGQTYEKVDDNKVKYLGFPDDKLLSITDLAEKYGLFLTGGYVRMDKKSLYFKYTEKEKEAQDIIMSENRFEPLDPVLPFNKEERAVVNENLQRLVTAANEFAINYVLKENYSDADWEKWLQKAKELGEDKLIQVYNDAQKKFDSN